MSETKSTADWSKDWQAMQQQYWNAWSDTTRQATPQAPPANTPWHEGLEQWGVSDAVRERYLGVIEGRCKTGMNGAEWQSRAVQVFEDTGCDRREALRRMLELYTVHMDSNEPVHTWPLP